MSQVGGRVVQVTENARSDPVEFRDPASGEQPITELYLQSGGAGGVLEELAGSGKVSSQFDFCAGNTCDRVEDRVGVEGAAVGKRREW
jgi:hypothetical protein